MSTQNTTLFPDNAETPDQIRGFLTTSGDVFHVGDLVCLIHRPTGSRVVGTLGGVYGVGRIRGFKIEGVPFAASGTAYFPMGKPGDEIYGLGLMERGEPVLAAAKAYYTQHDDTGIPWDAFTDIAVEGYILALGQAGKL